MKIVIPGGGGQVGTILARSFHRDGHEVVVLSRSPRPAAWRFVPWDGESLGDWVEEIDGSDVVINLAGRNVNCRYSRANRRRILDSRVRSTRAVGHAIKGAESPPPLWLQASTATIYAHRFDAANDEVGGLLGGDEPDVPPSWRFSVEVARAWEREVERADLAGTLKVVLRSAMIMSPDRGGIFDTLHRLARLGLGGRAGDGRQYVSWIHENDFLEAVRWLIREPLEGAVNLAAPQPLPWVDFMSHLRRACGARFGLPASRWMLELGAFFLRTETELMLKSRRVVPGRLLAAGFEFEYPEWEAAARELCERRQAA